MDILTQNTMEKDQKLSTEVTQKNIDPISFFDKDSDFVVAYKKAEKLASAIYMVTSLFSDNEPMKWTLRKKASELLSFTLNYKDTSQASEVDFIYNAKTKVLEIVSLLEVSFRGGLISDMNFSILKQEFMKFLETLSSVNHTGKNSSYEVIPKSFFEFTPTAKPMQNIAGNIPYSHLGVSDINQRISAENIKDITHNAMTKDELKRSNRQNIILSLLKKKKELTIKDIAQVIKDCSEKTIQRELNSFIANGVLKRAGVRRWSKYSLV